MKIIFDKIKLHNFGSYLDAEVTLRNRGFCTVFGRNYCQKDNALSNGSGKSFIWNAICYALTGETVNGLTKGLRNILANQSDDMYVELAFTVDSNSYVIKRGEASSKFLQIIKNDVDISGKTYTESYNRLQQDLPDMTRDLLTNTIILGQGLPNKFSALSAVDKKQRLEQLFKADYMIEDIKTRVANRLIELQKQIRQAEDKKLVASSQLTAINTEISIASTNLATLSAKDFATDLSRANDDFTNITRLIELLETDQQLVTKKIDLLSPELVKLSAEKTNQITEEFNAYSANFTALQSTAATITAKLHTCEEEVRVNNSIRDICPTCGQKIQGVVKRDVSKQEAEISKLKNVLQENAAAILTCNKKHQGYINEINSAFDVSIQKKQAELAKYKAEQLQLAAEHKKALDKKLKLSEQLATLKAEFQLQAAKLRELFANIDKLNAKKTMLESNLSEFEQELLKLQEHLAIVKKMDSLTKRDFRGYLLVNIVNYINEKAKTFCQTVFNNQDIVIAINNNSLDISYCKKMIDCLSGGERTRIDLILQLAIRATLIEYIGFNSNILVLDEITDFMDKQSCLAVMKLLSSELTTTESVFIISHRVDELNIPTDTELHIEKSIEGVSVVK